MSNIIGTTTPRVSMADLRLALPDFFTTGINDLVKALTDKGARIESLGQALAGCALERAQSGNLPNQWLSIEAASNALKGQTKSRALKALALVAGVKPASGQKFTVKQYDAFAYTSMMDIVALLTPPVAVKSTIIPVNYKALSEELAMKLVKAEAEALAFKAEAEALAVALETLRNQALTEATVKVFSTV